MDSAADLKLVESGEDIALLTDEFFVVDDHMDTPDRFLVVQRQAQHSALVVGRFQDFDYAHYCARRLSEYVAKYRRDKDQDGSEDR